MIKRDGNGKQVETNVDRGSVAQKKRNPENCDKDAERKGKNKGNEVEGGREGGEGEGEREREREIKRERERERETARDRWMDIEREGKQQTNNSKN